LLIWHSTTKNWDLLPFLESIVQVPKRTEVEKGSLTTALLTLKAIVKNHFSKSIIGKVKGLHGCFEKRDYLLYSAYSHGCRSIGRAREAVKS